MEEFPFQKVYDHFAQPMVVLSPVPIDLAPSLAIVRMKGEEIENITILPDEHVALFFRNASGKAALGEFLRMSLGLAKANNEPICLVLMAESYFKQTSIEGSKEETLKRLQKQSLANDPDASECIMISIYRPDEMRMGVMSLNEDRSLNYAPLMPTDGKISGRLTNHPDKDDLPEGMTSH